MSESCEELTFEMLFDEEPIKEKEYVIKTQNTINNTNITKTQNTIKNKKYKDSSPKWYKIIENSYNEKMNSFSPRDLNYY